MARNRRNCNVVRTTSRVLQGCGSTRYSVIQLETFEPRQLLSVAPITQISQVQVASVGESLSSPLRATVNTTVASAAPQLLLTPSVLSAVRAKAQANTPQW